MVYGVGDVGLCSHKWFKCLTKHFTILRRLPYAFYGVYSTLPFCGDNHMHFKGVCSTLQFCGDNYIQKKGFMAFGFRVGFKVVTFCGDNYMQKQGVYNTSQFCGDNYTDL